MNRRIDFLGIVGLLLAIFTLFFGDNIYEQVTGHSIWKKNPPPGSQVFNATEGVSTKGAFVLSPTPRPIRTDEINDEKGVPMRLVPGGEFTMGSNAGDESAQPAHTVYVSTYYIDKYEVTNTFYRACVDAGVCDQPDETYNYNSMGLANHPVVHVNWFMAKTYCEWRNARLPTEAEWEKAARGTDERTYPWGENIDNTYANYLSGIRLFDTGTRIVGYYQKDKSPYGVYDMAGNVFEWTADWYSEFYYQNSPSSDPLGTDFGQYRVTRGTAWNQSIGLRTFERGGLEPTATGMEVGFRCAYSVSQ